MVIRYALLLAATAVALGGQAGDPLEQAYAALRAKQYDAAIELFLKAATQTPNQASVRKDLAYAYLKIGETEAARDQFFQAMQLAPDDLHTALEYAFLCNQTGRIPEARRIFNQVRTTDNPELKATAEQAFQNVDRPLAEGIDRWTSALASNPDDFNAHRELALLAERRENRALAAEHYLKAWRLRPSERSLLVDCGRVLLASGRLEEAHAALLAARFGGEPRAAEAARVLLSARYPYVYEFREAIQLDPENVELRRELVYLLAAMGRKEESEKELAAIPKQLRERANPPAEKSPTSAKELGDRSYHASYLKDALQYYTAAHEQDSLDFQVMLQLGWTHNVLGHDDQALRWFELARKSPDPALASEAAQAYRALRPAQARLRVTAWLYPTYSARWKDVFTYGQVKAEWKLNRLPLRAYVSARFVGGTRQMSSEAKPQYLSESSFIPAVGLETSYWHGAMLWAEAGVAANYLDSRRNLPRLAPDYRGGIAFSKGYGKLLGSTKRGLFVETNDDGVFVSRFRNDVVLFSQNRAGFTAHRSEALGGLATQWYLNANAGTDLRREFWANTLEFGPGVRFRWAWMPPAWILSVNYLRGGYTVMEGNPRNRMYNDLRVGFWYAVTR